MIDIKPIIIPTKGTAKYFNLELSNNLKLPATSAMFLWELLPELEDEFGNPIPGPALLSGNITMSEAIYNNWGSDDNYAVDWALNELNLQRL